MFVFLATHCFNQTFNLVLPRQEGVLPRSLAAGRCAAAGMRGRQKKKELQVAAPVTSLALDLKSPATTRRGISSHTMFPWTSSFTSMSRPS